MRRFTQREILASILRRERNRRELTQKEVAEAVGVRLGTYQKWEQGLVYPSERDLAQLRIFFGSVIDNVAKTFDRVAKEIMTNYEKGDTLTSSTQPNETQLPNLLGRTSPNDGGSVSSYYVYDVALSFAGEDRSYADALAQALRRRGLKVFYDTYEKPTLWGKNLYTYLSDIYQNKARYCIMFLSENYATKLWTNHEREAAQARAFAENEEYILPIRLDRTIIPGISPTVSYLSWPPESAESIADMVTEKLSKRPLSAAEIISMVDTITDKMVLILGRFTPERKTILDAIRDELRKYNYSPILLDFMFPEGRSITDVLLTFAQMSRFIIVDLTDPSSMPQELALIVPRFRVPIQPLLLAGRREYAMFQDLQVFPWLLPIHYYTDQESLLQSLKENIIEPAEQKAHELAKR